MRLKNPLPPLRPEDTPVIIDGYYYVEAPWFVIGEFAKARYVGKLETDGPSLPCFRVDGSDRVFQVGNPYMVRADLETLRETFLTCAYSDLEALTDPDIVAERANGMSARIKALQTCQAETQVRS